MNILSASFGNLDCFCFSMFFRPAQAISGPQCPHETLRAAVRTCTDLSSWSRSSQDEAPPTVLAPLIVHSPWRSCFCSAVTDSHPPVVTGSHRQSPVITAEAMPWCALCAYPVHKDGWRCGEGRTYHDQCRDGCVSGVASLVLCVCFNVFVCFCFGYIMINYDIFWYIKHLSDASLGQVHASYVLRHPCGAYFLRLASLAATRRFLLG